MKNDAKVVLYSTLIVMALTITVYSLVFWDFSWGGPEAWTDFGGYFSGIVTPIVALGSAFLFYRSIKVQRNEFEKTRDEMKKATKLQQQVEESRQVLFRQEQLEQSIPKARKKQISSYEKLIAKLNQRRTVTVGPPQYGLTENISIEEARKKDENPNQINKLLLPYLLEGSHLSDMLVRYIEIGGNVYYFMDLIDEVQTEFSFIKKIHEVYGTSCKSDYETFDVSVRSLISEKDKALQLHKQSLYR